MAGATESDAVAGEESFGPEAAGEDDAKAGRLTAEQQERLDLTKIRINNGEREVPAGSS